MENGHLRILITGARGFIGKNLVEYFTTKCAERYTVFAPLHAELELLDTENVSDFIINNKIDYIIHCANVGGNRKTGYDAGRIDAVYNNLLMFFNLTRNLNSNLRMIFLGSGAEYDYRYYLPRMPEDYFGVHVPADAYGFSKFVCSKYIEGAEHIVNLRIFSAYGKYEDYDYRFISNSMVKNLLRLPIVINQNVFFDFVYVNDIVRIIEYFIEHKPNYKFYNVATGKTIDLVTVANKINKISGKPSEIIIKNKGLNTEYSADNSRLLQELEDFSFTPFDESLKEMYSWYSDILDSIDKEKIEKDEYVKYCRTK